MSLIVLGDLAFTGILSEQPEYNPARFEKVIPILRSSGMVIANLEVPIKIDDAKNEYKNFIHYSRYNQTRDLLKLLNIGCVSLANNHIYDCMMPGLMATINLLDSIGIYHTGAGWLPEHVEPVIFNVGNKRVSFFSYVDVSTNPKTENFPDLLINYFSFEKVAQDIKRIKSRADIVIVSLHWGVDYSNFYTKEQQQIGQELLQAGADIILGHHPHTIQPYEIYGNKLIFYSLGQLCFGDIFHNGQLRALNRKTKLGIITEINLHNTPKPVFHPTIEKENNFIYLSRINIDQKLKRLSFMNKKIHANRTIMLLVRIKETVYDRFYDYFFGYYRNFFHQIFAVFLNYNKIYYIIRDLRSHKKNFRP